MIPLTRAQAHKVKQALSGPSCTDKDLSDVYYMLDDALKAKKLLKCTCGRVALALGGAEDDDPLELAKRCMSEIAAYERENGDAIAREREACAKLVEERGATGMRLTILANMIRNRTDVPTAEEEVGQTRLSTLE